MALFKAKVLRIFDKKHLEFKIKKLEFIFHLLKQYRQ